MQNDKKIIIFLSLPILLRKSQKLLFFLNSDENNLIFRFDT